MAEVAVNNASKKDAGTLLIDEIGSISKVAPIAIIAKNPSTKLLAGLNVLLETTERLFLGTILSGITILSGLTCISNIPFTILDEGAISLPMNPRLYPPPQVVNIFDKICVYSYNSS